MVGLNQASGGRKGMGVGRGEARLSVVCHNVRSAGGGRLQDLEQAYRGRRADVVVMIAHRQRDLVLESYAQTVSVCDAENTHASLAMAWTTPVRDRVLKYYTARDSRTVAVLLQMRRGKRLLIVGHYRAPNKDVQDLRRQLAGLSTLIQHAKADDVLLMGDFNLRLDESASTVARTLCEWLADHYLVDREKHRHATYVSTQQVRSRIDYVFASPDLPMRCWVHEDRVNSDHHPIVCSLGGDLGDTGPDPAPPTHRLPLLHTKDDVEAFQVALGTGPWTDPSTLESRMIEAARATAGSRATQNRKRNFQPRFGKEVAALGRERFRLYWAAATVWKTGLDRVDRLYVTPKEWGWLRNVEPYGLRLPRNRRLAVAWAAWARMLDNRRAALDEQILKKRAEWNQQQAQQRLEVIDEQFRLRGYVSNRTLKQLLDPSARDKFYVRTLLIQSGVASAAPPTQQPMQQSQSQPVSQPPAQSTQPATQPSSQPSQLPRLELYSEPHRVLSAVREYVTTKWRSRQAELPPPLPPTPLSEPIEWPLEEVMAPTSLDDFQRELNAMPTHKAPGPDGLTLAHYRALPAEAKELACKKMTEWLTNPPVIETYMVFIPKPGKDPRVLDNLRPIALTPVLWRILARIMVRRLGLVLEGRLSPSQQAFVPGGQLAEHTMLLRNIIEHTLSAGEALFIAKTDMRQAYDSVEWEALGRALQRLQMPAPLIEFLMKTRRTTLSAETAYGATEMVPAQRGLMQGCPLSPLLFDIVLDEMLTVLDKHPAAYRWDRIRTPGLAFADDLALLASSEQDLQTLVDVTTAHLKRLGIDLNFAKCRGYLIPAATALQPSPSQPSTADAPPALSVSSPVVYLDPERNTRLQFADRDEGLKYLGVTFSLSGSTEEARAGVSRSLGYMKHLLTKNRDTVTPNVLIYLANVCFEPKIRYQLSTVITRGSEVDDIRNKFLHNVRRVLQLPYYLCLEALLVSPKQDGLGIVDVQARWLLATTQAVIRAIERDTRAGQSCIQRLEELQTKRGWPAQPLCLDDEYLVKHRSRSSEWLVDLARQLAQRDLAIFIPQVADRLSPGEAQQRELDAALLQCIPTAFRLVATNPAAGRQQSAADTNAEVARPAPTLQARLRAVPLGDGACVVVWRQQEQKVTNLHKEFYLGQQQRLLEKRQEHQSLQRLFPVPGLLLPPHPNESQAQTVAKPSQPKSKPKLTPTGALKWKWHAQWRWWLLYLHNALPLHQRLREVGSQVKTDRCLACDLDEAETLEHVFGPDGCPAYAELRAALQERLLRFSPEERDYVRLLPVPRVYGQGMVTAQVRELQTATQVVQDFVLRVWEERCRRCFLDVAGDEETDPL